MTRPAPILCINAGSSSLKSALYDSVGDGSLEPLVTTLTEGIGRPAGRQTIRDPSGHTIVSTATWANDHAAALRTLLDELGSHGLDAPGAVGHRVVHSGPHLVEHTAIDDHVLARLRASIPFAPLHLPAELDAIDAIAERFPDVAQVACFDTAFHVTMPDVARRLPLPAWVDDGGVRRFGFHGLSCEYVVDRLGAATLGRAVIAHLGSGASLTAVLEGRSVDTTMGFTPTGGVVMGTRTGDLDPGVLVHLARTQGLDADALEQLVDRQSGLLGLSGLSPDMHELLAARASHPAAALAIDSFCRSVRQAIGALTTDLGGLDTLVFTAGIGENEPAVRSEICGGLEHLGVRLDPGENERGQEMISAKGAHPLVRVVATDENLMIARHTVRLSG